MLSAVKNSEKMIGKINSRYDMTAKQIFELMDAYVDPVSVITAAFRFGYLQGGKAKVKELKSKKDVSK